MKKYLALAAALALAGCATQPPGQFSSVPAPIAASLAAASSDFLAATFPPAHTKMVLAQPTDAYGLALTGDLRKAGFAVDDTATAQALTVKADTLGYVAQASTSGLVTVLLRYDAKTYGRAFNVDGGNVHPVGAWSVRGQP
jgi:hypothetical protein